MTYKTLYIWVEGTDDERLVSGVLRQHLRKKYDDVQIIKYAQESAKKINNFLRSVLHP